MQASLTSHSSTAGFSAKKRAMRKCIVSGETAEKSDLIRFVAGPDGYLVLDLAEKLPGRGAWVSASPQWVEDAARKGRFKRHIDAVCDDPAMLVSHVASQIERRFLQHLSMLRRAGLAICGGGAIREEGHMQILLIADDASAGESRQLISAVRPEWVEEGLPAELLGQAAGRGSVAYIGIIPLRSAANRKMCEQFLRAIARWRLFCVNRGHQEGTEQK